MPTSQVTTAARTRTGNRKAEPVWEIAESFPLQGQWTEEDYLDFPESGRRIEFVDGCLEYLPMPTITHERVVKRLFFLLHAFIEAAGLGEVFFSGTKMKLRKGQIRLPDIMLVLNDRLDKHTDDYFLGADLVMEVVSPSAKDRKRDLVEKRTRYAEAGIAEYWIVDPELKQISVLKLDGDKYKVHGEFKIGQKARSAALKGFEVDVTEALAGMKR